MPTEKLSHRITLRDANLLTMIDRHPFTANQLLRVSKTFPEPFTQDRLLRRRLGQLRTARMVQDFPSATIREGGAPHYWKLTREGHHLVHGYDETLPSRRQFEAIAAGHHHHTLCLREFLTKVIVAAHAEGIRIDHFASENSVCLEAGEFRMYPDCAFQLTHPDGRTFNFVIELDNSTERLRSRMDVESIERKIRGYDAHQSQFDALDPSRYVVLFITTRSDQRLQHILDLASGLMQNPDRTVFLGVTLTEFVTTENPFRKAVIKDHRGLKRTLTPMPQSRLQHDGDDVKNTQRGSSQARPAQRTDAATVA
ncbi:MAG: replication-relaxation family protein [Planctomycetaceae bacterium]|nr:replication-relaxation family protein [Planctomycetaceae bacterium]